MKSISAEQMGNISDFHQRWSDPDTIEFEEVMKKMEEEASKGRYDFWFPGILRKLVRKELESLGYKVGIDVGKNSTYTQIHWMK